MQLPRGLVDELNLESTLKEAEARRGDFFPSRLPFRAAQESSTFLPTLRKRLIRNYEPGAAQIVEVPKWGGGTRPAVELTLDDRLVYDSLISFLKTKVPPGLVNESPVPHDRGVVETTLVDGEKPFLLVADIASFYEYIQHDLLLNELIDLTAEGDAVEALATLLRATLQRGAGIPQGPPSSGFLADVYVSIADRQIQRSGFRVVRFSDDYRIPADSWHQTIEVQLRLERALRGIGLILNAAKTRTLTRERYRIRMARRIEMDLPPDLEVEARTQDQAEGDRPEFVSPYLDLESSEELLPLDEADPTVVGEFAAIMAAPKYWGDRENTELTWALVPRLLKVATYDSPDLSTALPILLERFPHISKEISLALRRRMGTDREDEALEAISAALEHRRYLFPWQRGLLFHAIVPAHEVLPTALMDAARAELEDTQAPWFSRGRAALVLGTERLIEVSDAFRTILDNAPEATRVDLVGAVATVADHDSSAAALLKAEARTPLLEAVPGVIERGERRLW